MENIAIAWANFNWVVALSVMIAYFLIDALYAYYTYAVVEQKAVTAANTGFVMHFLLAFGVINYTQNMLYILPIAIGSWIGTYLVVKHKKVFVTAEAGAKSKETMN